MHRLFVAIRPPETIREQLLDMMEGVAGARWQDEEQLHLTLRFVGEVDRHAAADVDSALASVRHPPFELRLAGLGAFERRGEPATLWVGLDPEDPLHALHKKIDQALQRAGLAPERRAYSPHITLARLPRGAGPVQPLIERWGGVASAAFLVDEFRLYESRLAPSGPIHTVAGRYSLT